MKSKASINRTSVNRILPPRSILDDAKTNFSQTIKLHTESTTDQAEGCPYNFVGPIDSFGMHPSTPRPKVKRVPSSQPFLRKLRRLDDQQIKQLVKEQMKLSFQQQQEDKSMFADSFNDPKPQAQTQRQPKNAKITSNEWASQLTKKKLASLTMQRANSKHQPADSIQTLPDSRPAAEAYSASQVIASLKNGRSLLEKKPAMEVIDSQLKNASFRIRQSSIAHSRSKTYQFVDNSQKQNANASTDSGKRTFPEMVYHLPEDLELNLQAFNDFYKTRRTVHNSQDLGEPSDSKANPGDAFYRVVRKVAVLSQVGKEIKQIQRRKDQLKREAEKEESERLQSLTLKIQARLEKEQERAAVDHDLERLKLAKQMQTLRPTESLLTVKPKKPKRKSRSDLDSPPTLKTKMLDIYSAKKATGLKPYRSYWLRCIDDCLAKQNLFDAPGEGEPADTGYYRVVLPKKESQPDLLLEAAEEHLLLERAMRRARIEYTFMKSSIHYLFEFDGLLRVIKKYASGRRRSSLVGSAISFNEQKNASSRSILDHEEREERIESLLPFLDMLSRVDQDIAREYPLLFPAEEH